MKHYLKPSNFIAILLLLFVGLSSCDKIEEANPNLGAQTTGFFIINEGNFGKTNASIDFYSNDKPDEIQKSVFFSKNNRQIGDQLQSASVINDKVYAVVQNSSKVEVFDAKTFASIATIEEGITSPRYITKVSDEKAYIAQWKKFGSTDPKASLAIVDLTTNKITKSLALGINMENMLVKGDLVYITSHDFNANEKNIYVVNHTTDELVKTIAVETVPKFIHALNNGDIVVGCSGYSEWDAEAMVSIQKEGSHLLILGSNDEVKVKLPFEKNGLNNVIVDKTGENIFYTYSGNLYKMKSTDTALPTTAFKEKVNYYGLSYSDLGMLVGFDAGDFTNDGTISLIDPVTAEVKKTFTAGIIPARSVDLK